MIQVDDELLLRLDRLERLGWAFVWAVAARSGAGASLYRLADLARTRVGELAPLEEKEPRAR